MFSFENFTGLVLRPTIQIVDKRNSKISNPRRATNNLRDIGRVELINAKSIQIKQI